MPRKYTMSWEGGNQRRWVKMVKGTRYRVQCSTLAELYPPLPEECWTKEGSYHQANRWMAEQLGKVQPTFRERQMQWAMKNAPEELVEIEKEEDYLRRGIEIAEEYGIIIPDDVDRTILHEFFGQRTVWCDRFNREDEIVPKQLQLGQCIDEFLALAKQQQKPLTYHELSSFLDVVKGWFGSMDASKVNETTVEEAFKKIAALDISQNTKFKRWGFFKRLVNRLYEINLIQLPRNLKSKLLSFEKTTSKIKTYSPELVKETLIALPDKLEVYALLGLNAGMTNADIAALTQDMVKDGYLERRRVKTGHLDSVPTVKYKLWDRTIELLNKFKTTDPDTDLWFLSNTGTPLITTLQPNGEISNKDLINLAWKRYGKSKISISKFRNIAATMLESHEVYGRYVEHFLGHSPKSIKDKHYAAPSQQVFDNAMTWLQQQYQ